MNISQKARLEGIHRRWHVRRGIKKSGCTFCEGPSLGVNIKDQRTESPSLTSAQPQGESQQDHFEALEREVQANVAKMLEKDRLWACATTGLSLTDAALVMEVPLQLFVGMVEANFKRSWSEVLHQARLCNKRDLSLAAVKAAKDGDTRLLIRLSDKGFFDSWLIEERDESIRTSTTQELEERLRVYFKPHIPYSNMASTCRLIDATDEEIKRGEAENSQENSQETNVFAGTEKEIVEDVSQKEQEQELVGDDPKKEQPSVSSVEPAADAVETMDRRPATYSPANGQPLVIKQRFYDE